MAATRVEDKFFVMTVVLLESCGFGVFLDSYFKWRRRGEKCTNFTHT